jgi:hypothetical protein
VQPQTDAGESEDSGGSDVVKQHRGDQSSRSAALRVIARQPAGDTEREQRGSRDATEYPRGGCVQPEPTRSTTVAEGEHSRARPATSSIAAVTVYRLFMDEELLNRRSQRKQRKFSPLSLFAPVEFG